MVGGRGCFVLIWLTMGCVMFCRWGLRHPPWTHTPSGSVVMKAIVAANTSLYETPEKRGTLQEIVDPCFYLNGL